ncbi:MAG: TonB-dependent receptor [Gammaproteobacteria bacterium]
MKSLRIVTFASAAIIAVQVHAEHEQLPTLVVEGETTRPGELGVMPDSSGLNDTASLLKRVPGANVNRNGPLTGIAQYRGLYGNRVNISIDGANMKEAGPNSMDPPLSHHPAPLTESLHVYRGIAPVSSGIETIGGSMKAKSRKGQFAEAGGIEWDGVAAAGYSSVDNGKFGALFSSIASENHKIYLSGSEEKGDNYKYKNHKKVRPTRYDREAFTAGYGYRRDGHEIGLNFSHNDTGHTGTPALPMDIMYVRGGLYDGQYSWDMGDGYQIKTNFFYQKMRHLMNNFTLREAPLMMGMPMLRQNRTEVEGGGLDLALSMPLFDGEFTIGVNGDQSNHDALITNPAMAAFFIDNFKGVERDRYSGYLEWKGDLIEDLSLELGARYIYAKTDADDVNYFGLPGPVGVNAAILRDQFNTSDHNRKDEMIDLVALTRYALSSTFDVEVGFARKNRGPSYQERYLWMPLESTGGLADGQVYIGDIGLDDETAYQFELGVEWHTAGAYVAPRIFYHYIDDYIQGLPTDNTAAQDLENAMAAMQGRDPRTVLQFTNIDAQLFGADLEAGYVIDDNWRLDGTLSYVRGQRVDGSGDDDLYRIAPLNGRAQVTYEKAGWMGSVEGVFYAGQGDVAGYNDEKKTSGYAVLNLRGQYEPYHGLVIGAGIENVLDKEHYDHLGGYNRVSNNTDLRQGSRIALPGRNFYATLSYNW